MDESNGGQLQERLAGLFRQTGSGHHQAFIESNGFDPEWPGWYASHLKDQLSEVLGVELSQAELASWFAEADQEHRRLVPGADWPEFFAELFLERFG
jgi:hypothetical protein